MLKTTTSRLAAFAAVLVLTGGAAAAAGSATNATPPMQDCLRVAAADAGVDADMAAKGSGGHGGAPMVEAVPGSDGQRTELAGLELEPASRSLTAGGSATWRFRVVDCDGKAVRSFDPEQGKLLHLIVVRTDFTGYQHLHPTLAADGTWSVEIEAPQAGRYRAIADFVIDERKYVLGTTLVAPGPASDPVARPCRACRDRRL
jgi:hypothetical protein